MRRIAATGVSIILALAACGSDDDATSEPSPPPEAPVTRAPSTSPPTEVPRSTITASTSADTTMSTDTMATGTTITAPEQLDVVVEDQLKQSVEAYVAAFGSGEPDGAVALLSQRCLDTIPMADYRAAVAAAGELYPGLVVDEFYDIILDGDRAVVYYATDPEVETEDGERWILESDAWVWDDC